IVQAVFAGIGKGDVFYDENPAIAKQRKRWQSLLAGTNLLAPENHPLIDEWEAQRGSAATWQPLEIETLVAAVGATRMIQPDRSILSGGRRPDTEAVTVTGTTMLRQVTA